MKGAAETRTPLYSHGSTQCNMPPALSGEIAAFTRDLPEEHLGLDRFGGDEPHVTVKYGLMQTDVAAEKRLRALCRTLPPIEIRLGKTSLFPASDEADNAQDVLKLDVESPALRELNKRIAATVPCTETHPVYRPHVTLAYLRPGLGQRYTGNRTFEGRRITLDHLLLSNRYGEKIVLPFLGKVPTHEGSTTLMARVATPLTQVPSSTQDAPLAKSMIRHPGSHGALLWHYDTGGHVVYGPNTPPPVPQQPLAPDTQGQDTGENQDGDSDQGQDQHAPVVATTPHASPASPPGSPPAQALPRAGKPRLSDQTASSPPPSADGSGGAPRSDQGQGQPTVQTLEETDRRVRALLGRHGAQIPADLRALLSFPARESDPPALAGESTALLAQVQLTQHQVDDWRASALAALRLAQGQAVGSHRGRVAPTVIALSSQAGQIPAPPRDQTSPGAPIACPWWQDVLLHLAAAAS